MNRARFILAAFLLAGSTLLTGQAAQARSDTYLTFMTPSTNIRCMYWKEAGRPASLRCDIYSGFRPAPWRPASCDVDWGVSVGMRKTGRAHMNCVGDAVDFGRVIRYGTNWQYDGFRCTSRTIGLTCKNWSGHGFFLSRERSYFF
jgi:hypothetical protein